MLKSQILISNVKHIVAPHLLSKLSALRGGGGIPEDADNNQIPPQHWIKNKNV